MQEWLDAVKTDDGCDIPATYAEFLDVFSKKGGETLPLQRDTDHAIEIEDRAKLPFGRIYKLSETKLAALKVCIETNLENGFIQRSSSPLAAPLLFVKKRTAVCGYASITGC